MASSFSFTVACPEAGSKVRMNAPAAAAFLRQLDEFGEDCGPSLKAMREKLRQGLTAAGLLEAKGVFKIVESTTLTFTEGEE